MKPQTPRTLPLGAYRPAKVVKFGQQKIVYLSGTTSGEEAAYDISGQTRIIFRRFEELLIVEGGNLENLVKINAYLVDIREYPDYNAVRNEIMTRRGATPASATIGGAQLLRPGARIELDGIAVI